MSDMVILMALLFKHTSQLHSSQLQTPSATPAYTLLSAIAPALLVHGPMLMPETGDVGRAAVQAHLSEPPTLSYTLLSYTPVSNTQAPTSLCHCARPQHVLLVHGPDADTGHWDVDGVAVQKRQQRLQRA